jgi:pimeloyl-ACP methyl ester carboxylesterase
VQVRLLLRAHAVITGLPVPRVLLIRVPPVSTDLDVVETGTGDELVVFVHGVLDRGGSFDRVADCLADECRMLWYDRRGYASAVDAPGAPVEVDRHVEDLVEVLDGRSAVVVGHSFGGVTALGAACRIPELVDAVVLYETAMPWLPVWKDGILREWLWADDAEDAVVRGMFGDRFERMTAEEQAVRLREGKAFVAEERVVRLGTAPFDVAELASPLLYGLSDSYPFPALPEYLHEVVPDVETVLIPGAGHNAHRSKPTEFADLVRRGIARARDSRDKP